LTRDGTFEKIKSWLGKPYHESEMFLLYNADCLESMKNVPGSTVDLTVTSPPYNIGKEYETVRPLEDYLDWSKKWIHV